MTTKPAEKKETSKLDILVIIPARGGSVGVPRKNLRNLNGKPLIAYCIKNALSSKFNLDVYVSSDDEEILHIASKLGAKKYKRDSKIADGITTLDPVIYDAYKNISKKTGKKYKLIVTLQATSPLLKTKSLDEAIEKMINNEKIDTIISAKDSTHLSWRKENNKFIPNYTKRVNRQQLPSTYIETGGFLITRDTIISENNRIGKNVELCLLSRAESIDIDTFEDFNLSEYYLKRKSILFVVTGNKEVGYGHIYRTLLLASNITAHAVSFLFDKNSEEGFQKLKPYKFDIFMQKNDDLIEDIKKIKPDVIINDILDTEKEYILALKDMGLTVINFEDLGSGSKEADIVINALYKEHNKNPKFHSGYKYFCARDEFILTKPKHIENKVKNILITFGGTDPSNYTLKTCSAIYDYAQKNNIELNVVLGLGYDQEETLSKFKNIKIYKDIKSMSNFIEQADIIFTALGRTVFEIACIGTPAIVMAQSERELLHTFASNKTGFINLGHGNKVSDSDLVKILNSLIKDYERRKEMNKIMLSKNLKAGISNVLKLIYKTIEENN